MREARAADLARARAGEGAARARLDALRGEDGRWDALRRSRLEGRVDLAKLQLVDACRASLERRIRDAAGDAERLAAEAEERRLAFLDADRDLRALELLVGQRREAARLSRARREQQAIDE